MLYVTIQERDCNKTNEEWNEWRVKRVQVDWKGGWAAAPELEGADQRVPID
jgi:hypothetical protein